MTRPAPNQEPALAAGFHEGGSARDQPDRLFADNAAPSLWATNAVCSSDSDAVEDGHTVLPSTLLGNADRNPRSERKRGKQA